MSPNIALVLVAATLIGTGVYLLLARSIVRALVGFLLMGNGINILFMVSSGPAGEVPILGHGDGDRMADPIPQALVLTAIVITLAMVAFVLSLAHRAWQLGRDDLLEDDEESVRIHRRAEENDLSDESRDDADVIAAEFAEEDE
ncbi:Na(+)/H(+) antiporter subunit C [Ornithinimicrobium cavernae]|uniref:Na(+)/H(+) antiporter subunit C n=1 Tax=Ornithinimicrobium cavernae TaxID=2666047 RepID=UPI000D694418|nr:Na(+)/H(+) antiporter subunit C [Ornithinimicrobium cavernae]